MHVGFEEPFCRDAAELVKIRTDDRVEWSDCIAVR